MPWKCICISGGEWDALGLRLDFNVKLIPLKEKILKHNVFLMYIKDVGEVHWSICSELSEAICSQAF